MTRRFLPPLTARPMPPEVAALLADAEAAAIGDAYQGARRPAHADHGLLDALLPPDGEDMSPEAAADLAELDRLIGASGGDDAAAESRRDHVRGDVPHGGTALAGDLVGVVAPAPLVHAAAGGVAAAVRRRWKAPTAVVVCPGGRAGGGPSTRRAAALARRLGARGFDAASTACLCRVTVPAEPLALVAEVRRLLAATPDGVPVVLGVGGRDAEVDELLASATALVLALPASPDPALAELARASLATVGPPAGEVVVPTDPLGRRVTAAGLRPLDPRGAPW